jgi:dual specificity tyrosine-phosphorylation-regulated kinase 2/3/4
MPVSQTLKYHMAALTTYEQGEILDFQTVYYIGKLANKKKPTVSNQNNFGFDDDRGDYQIVMRDHIAYQYEIVETVGKGSFGQVLRAFDHKAKEFIALKIIRNKSRFHKQAKVEIKVLRFLKDKDP